MVTGVAACLFILLFGYTLHAAEVEPNSDGAESAESRARVGVVGEVPPRPELEVFSGVSGWVVNGQEIPLELVEKTAAAWHGPYILQDLVAELLLQQEAERRGIELTEEDISRKAAVIRTELGVRSEAALESFLRAKRVTLDWLYAKARSYALMDKVLSDQVYVDDREIERAYRSNQELYRRGEMVGFRAMRFLDRSLAEAALAEIRRGRSFQEVAKETAPTPQERTIAGDIQYYERSQQSLPPEFEAALFAAPLNQVAGPVEIRGSYYLLRVEKKLDPRQFTLDDVRDVVREQLEKQKLEQIVWPNWIRDQLGRAQIAVRTRDATPETIPDATPDSIPDAEPEATSEATPE
jgi:hypothetical protein